MKFHNLSPILLRYKYPNSLLSVRAWKTTSVKQTKTKTLIKTKNVLHDDEIFLLSLSVKEG